MVEISEFSYDNPRFKNLLSRKPGSSEDVEKTVSEVIKNIKENGDKALFFYMKEFDHVDIKEIGLMVSKEEFEQAEEIQRKIENLSKNNDLVKTTETTFKNYGDIFVIDSLEEVAKAVNMIAPEHAEILVDDYELIVKEITNAGALFIGEYSTEPVGDYY